MKCSVCGREYLDDEIEENIQFATENREVVVCRDCGERMLQLMEEKFPRKKTARQQEKQQDMSELGQEIAYLEAIIRQESPSRIKAHLDQYVIGQEGAKKTLSVAVYNHYKRLLYQRQTRLREAEGKEIPKQMPSEIQKSSILMLGPSGTGKTFLLKSIAEYLDVPFSVTDASNLTASGYVGTDVETCIRDLYEASGRDVHKTERGIIFLDEFDKIARKSGENRSITADPGHEAVQQELLKIIEGGKVHISMMNRKHPDAPTITIDTTDILFVCGGAFEGIEKIIEKRLDSINGFGFGKKNKEGDAADDPTDHYNYLLDHVMQEDFRKYGIIPEILGRLPIICKLHQLKEEDLIRILIEPKNALLKQYRTLFNMDQCELGFSKEALHEIAAKALKTGTGARALRTIVENILLDTMYHLPDLAGRSEEEGRPVIRVTKEAVRTGNLSIGFSAKSAV